MVIHFSSISWAEGFGLVEGVLILFCPPCRMEHKMGAGSCRNTDVLWAEVCWSWKKLETATFTCCCVAKLVPSQKTFKNHRLRQSEDGAKSSDVERLRRRPGTCWTSHISTSPVAHRWCGRSRCQDVRLWGWWTLPLSPEMMSQDWRNARE
jgi:hypothetical protein